MDKVKMWWTRNFKVISGQKATSIGLRWNKNVFDNIFYKSEWYDEKGRTYKVYEFWF